MRRVSVSPECLVSVDIEASGPSPSRGSMLSIGACLVEDPGSGIYLELKPVPEMVWQQDAEKIHGLARDRLEREGLEPAAALTQLDEWLTVACAGRKPVFVGFNAPFDWMFVADYFWRYLGRNPFGISALDLKSYYMSHGGVRLWAETRKAHVKERLRLDSRHSHHALDDAREQADMARVLLGYR